MEFGEKRKIRAIMPFEVIEVGINRKPVCDFPLLINSNWHPTSYRFRVIAAYCSNFGQFTLLSPLWGLRTTYDVHLTLIGKRVLDFLLVLIKLFSLGVTSYDWSAMSEYRFKIGERISVLLTFNLSFKFRFIVVLFDVMLGFRFTVNTQTLW